jgi:hypothetical protein
MVRGNLAPGVYLEEIPSGIHPIEGVPTSITAFVGAAAKGPVASPVLVSSFPDFATQYGGLTDGMPLGYAVQQYFANGGSAALIARVESSGGQLVDADLSDPALEKKQRGLWLLDQAERLNILCIPPLAPTADVGKVTWDTAVAYARKRRAFVIVDPPAVWANAQAVTASSLAALVSPAANAAVYFPRLRGADPLHGNQIAVFAPCGAVAGLYARTDQYRGVWHSPAGAEANLLGFQAAAVTLSTPDTAALDALKVNAIRPQPALAAWGRTRSRRIRCRRSISISRCGGLRSTSSRASPWACAGRCSSRTCRRCGRLCGRASMIFCAGCGNRAGCKARRRTMPISCASTRTSCAKGTSIRAA